MSEPGKYAVVERERRYLLAGLPDGITSTVEIVDLYLTGTRLRLREVRTDDGTVTRKLGHKVRMTTGPAEIAHTSLYLDDEEWALLCQLPARRLHKRRHLVRRDGFALVVDEHDDGALIAEIDDGDQPCDVVPVCLAVVQDVSDDESWTGVALAGPAVDDRG